MTRPSLAGLLASRMGSLLLALLCAVVAGVLVLFALSRVKTNVTQPLPQATALIATGLIHKGETGAQIVARHLYKATPVTTAQLVPGAISDASVLTGATALTTVSPGAQLTVADFGTVVGVDQVLNGNQRAVEISTDGAPGAVDITQVDSRVDVWSKVSGGQAVLVAPDVLVMKPATATPVTLGNQVVSGSTIVLRVSAAMVKPILTNVSSLYFVLRHGTGSVTTTPATVTPTTSTTTGATP